jgi:hypothetical protein
MSTAPSFRPRDIAASEPVALATAARAALYLFLTNRGVDPQTMAMLVTVFEVALAYMTRQAVTPVRRVSSGPRGTVDTEDVAPNNSDSAARDEAQSAIAR